MNGEEVVTMDPWWHRFTGEIKSTGKNKYEVTGIARKVDDSTIEVIELPIHKWTANFKKDLEAMMAGDKTDAVKVGSVLRSLSTLLTLLAELPRAPLQ